MNSYEWIIESTNEIIFPLTNLLAELHPRAKRARGRSPTAKEMW